MFIGRQKELRTLNKLYATDRFQFPVIYGRRRVGKTALINEFIKDKPAIYFTGVESNEKQNLENFSKAVFQYESDHPVDSTFSSFQSALEYLFQKSEHERFIVVIDEYPYVAKSSPSLASTLQLLIDRYKSTSKMFLILCGSSMSFMENQVLAYKAPLYGRRTAQLKIVPFDFFETREFFSNYSLEDQALLYGLVGGTPQYMLRMDQSLSVKENMAENILNTNAALFEEPINLLKQEVRDANLYNAIISAVASGHTRMSEIATKIGEDSAVCANYLRNLLSLGLIQKQAPFGDFSTRKTIYRIEDNLFRFWYRFVPENHSLLSRGATELVCQRIEPHLSTYMGAIFEDICTQYLWRTLLKGKLDFVFDDLGRWWGTNPKTRQQQEIDILGSIDKDSALFAECKWTNEKVDCHVLDKLIERSNLFNYQNKYFFLFAKRGFTEACQKRANEIGTVKLIDFEMMV